MQLWQLKWSNYQPMPKQCYLNILYFTHQPMISQDLEESRDTSMGGTKLTKRRGTCSVKKSKIEGISEQCYILVTNFVVFFL